MKFQSTLIFVLVLATAGACQPQGNPGSQSAGLEGAPKSSPGICSLDKQAIDLIATKRAEWETVAESDIPPAVTPLVQNLKTSEGQQSITPCADSLTAAIFGSDYNSNPVSGPRNDTLALSQNSESMADGRRAYVIEEIRLTSRYLYIPRQNNMPEELIRLRQRP